MGYIPPGFLPRSKGATAEQQLYSERTPVRFGLGVVVGVVRPGESGHEPRQVATGMTGGAGVPAVAVCVDTEPRRGLAQRRSLLECQQHEFSGHLRG